MKYPRLHGNYSSTKHYRFVEGRLRAGDSVQSILSARENKLSRALLFQCQKNFRLFGTCDPRELLRRRRRREREQQATVRRLRRKRRHGNDSIPEDVKDYIVVLLDRDATLYSDELQDYCRQRFGGTTYSVHAINRTLRSLNYTRKVIEQRAMEQCQRARETFATRIRDYDPKKIIFIDETLRNRHTHKRRRGRAPRGLPAVRRERMLGTDTANYTLFAACNYEGFLADACWVVRGNCGAQECRHYLFEFVVPRVEPGGCVVLDNSSLHHALQVELERAVRLRGGAVEWLAPYSPTDNPIEEMFAVLKKWLRRHRGLAANHPRRALELAVRRCLDRHSAANIVAGARGVDNVQLYDVPYFPTAAEEEEMAAAAAAVVVLLAAAAAAAAASA